MSIEFATSSQRLPTNLVEKLKTEHVDCWVKLSCVGRCRPLAVATHFPILQPTRLDKLSTCSVFNSSTKSVVNYSSCKFNTHGRQLSRVGVSGVYWALVTTKKRLVNIRKHDQPRSPPEDQLGRKESLSSFVVANIVIATRFSSSQPELSPSLQGSEN